MSSKETSQDLPQRQSNEPKMPEHQMSQAHHPSPQDNVRDLQQAIKGRGLATVKAPGVDDTQMTAPSGSTSKAHTGHNVPIC